MDSRYFQICYLDTGKETLKNFFSLIFIFCFFFPWDSLIVTTSKATLEECVKADRLHEYRRDYFKLFENPNSPFHQSGLFKLEGQFDRGYFPGLKNYYLDSEIGHDNDDRVKKISAIKSALYRAKGISQSCQDNLSVDNFKVSVDNSKLFTHRWQLKCFPNLTVGIAPSARKLNKPLNLKRTFVVGLHWH
jgi:hypothetical protein